MDVSVNKINSKIFISECEQHHKALTGARFGRVRKFAKSDYQLHYVCQSARWHKETRLPLDGFSRHLILLGGVQKIC